MCESRAMKTGCGVRRWAVTASFVLFFALGSRLSARDGRWLETASWSGSGPFMTPLFTVNSDTWRLSYRIKSRRSFKITVFNGKHEQIAEARNLEGPLPGYTNITSDKGQYYLAISDTDMKEWQVTVKQYLSKTEEQQLLDEMHAPRPPMHKLAVLYGKAGSESFILKVPASEWKIIYSTLGADGLRLVTRRTDEEGLIGPPLILDGNNSGESWIHSDPGHFQLTIESQSPWKVEVYY